MLLKRLYFVSLMLLSTAEMAFAAPSCRELFSYANAPMSPSEIRGFRMENLGNDGTKSLEVNGMTYSVLGRLGRGSFNVYLARSASGKLFVVKEMPAGVGQRQKPTFWMLAYFEFVTPLFFRESHISVPRVLDMEIRDDYVFIVKEYIEGLTYEEIINLKSITEEHRKQLLSELSSEMNYLMYEIYGRDKPNPNPDIIEKIPGSKRFTKWLGNKSDQLESRFAILNILKRKLESSGDDNMGIFNVHENYGDFRRDNFLWSSLHGKWILNDP